MKQHSERCTVLTLNGVLRLLPTDDRSWQDVFAYIEANHMGFNSGYWTEFLADVRSRGIVTPIVISDGRVVSGHHRVWAASRLAIDTIPVIETDRPRPWLWLQSQREADWQNRPSAT